MATKQAKEKGLAGLAALTKKLMDRHPKGNILLSKTTSFMCRVDRLAWLDVMAERAGTSRSEILSQIIEAGIDEALGSLDEQTLKQLTTRQLEIMDNFIIKHRDAKLGDLFGKEG